MNSDARRTEKFRARLDDPDEAVEELLRNIEGEPVPERLLMLARQLQTALAERRARLCRTDGSNIDT